MNTQIANIFADSSALVAAHPELGNEQDIVDYLGGDFYRLILKNGTFRLVQGEDSVNLGMTVKLIIAKTAQAIGSRAFEAAWDEESTQDPVCWSSNGEFPDANVGSPHNSECASCEWNARGSADQGEGRKCARRLVSYAVLDGHEDKKVAFTINAVSLWGDDARDGGMCWTKFARTAYNDAKMSYSAFEVLASVDPDATKPNTARFLPVAIRVPGTDAYEKVEEIRREAKPEDFKIVNSVSKVTGDFSNEPAAPAAGPKKEPAAQPKKASVEVPVEEPFEVPAEELVEVPVEEPKKAPARRVKRKAPEAVAEPDQDAPAVASTPHATADADVSVEDLLSDIDFGDLLDIE